ncbi:MAG: tRNA lysidine(34) synthetase TilS, partial [Candidatus Eisenbacteria bacterium]|nr:tRNA lysidine(34) synthetase TilS [Candidatus Eisenbacteria bacterium]
MRLAFRGPCALARGERILVATSGGADSTALLAALCSLAGELGLSLHAAHLHHGLRGADADADLAHVRESCLRLGVPLTALRMDGRARLRHEGLSGEAGLRSLRRRFLLAAAQRANCAFIATAHTADDQLETLLMRLARGTGLTGLGGMRARHGVWIKPLLGATRADIERDLARAGLSWREDASNASDDHLRNRIRHAVVPALARAVSPAGAIAATRATLARHAAASARDAAGGARAVRALAARVLARAVDERDPLRADLRVLAAQRNAAVRAAAFRLWWKRANPASSGLQRPALAMLLARLGRPAAAARLELP